MYLKSQVKVQYLQKYSLKELKFKQSRITLFLKLQKIILLGPLEMENK